MNTQRTAAVKATRALSILRRSPSLAVALVLLAVSASMLIGSDAQVILLVVAVAAGMPHGGLDHLAGRRLLAPRWGRWWPVPFLTVYLGLAGAVLLAWYLAPAPTLSGFLALSIVHFGAEDAAQHGTAGLFGALAHGGPIVVVPAIIYPNEIAHLFEWLAGPEGSIVQQLTAAPFALLWLTALTTLAERCIVRPRPNARRGLAEIACLAVMFALTPPLIGFALYFTLVHTPRAFGSVVQALGLASVRWALLQAVPLAGLALLAGAVLFWCQAGIIVGPAMVKTTFMLLSALTVPHMLLEWCGSGRLLQPESTGHR